MRARHRQTGLSHAQRSGGKPARRGQRRGGARVLRGLASLFLLISVFAPVVQLDALAAMPEPEEPSIEGRSLQQPGGPPPLEQVFGVSVGGDVASFAGGQIPLQSLGDGTWIGTAAIPAGSYGYTIVVSTADGDISLGQGGQQSPPEPQANVSVPDGSLGAVFYFNQYSGETDASGLIVQLATDFGQFPMIQNNSGNFEVSFTASPGSTIGIETIVLGEPTGISGQATAGQSGRIRVVADGNGNILAADPVQTASLSVFKTDESDNPLPGACFAAVSGNSVISQSCDPNDGSNDGVTQLLFLDGVPGSVNVVETFTPSGQETSESQQAGLQPGSNQIQMIAPSDEPIEEPPVEEPPVEEPPVEEAPFEEPTVDEPQVGFTVDLVSTGPDGNPLPGACYTLDGGSENCDQDGDGVVTFEGVSPGQHTITQTQPPTGYESFGSADVEIQGDAQFNVPQTPLEQPEQPGTIVAVTVNEFGQEISFVCYVVSTFGQVCDGDDPDNLMTQEDVPPGQYSVQLQVPEGYEPVGPTEQTATVNSGETVTVQFQVQTVQEQPEEPTPTTAPEQPEEGVGTINAITTDEFGQELPFVCYEVEGRGQLCDGDDPDNMMTEPDVPAGEYSVALIVPEGYEPAGPTQQTVTVIPGGVAEARFQVTSSQQVEDETPTPTAEAPEEPTPTTTPEEPGFGVLVAGAVDEFGQEIPFVCFQVTTFGEVCDGDDPDAVMTQPDVPPGDYTVQIVVPEGYEPVGPTEQTATVTAGETTTVVFQLQSATEDEPTPTVTPEAPEPEPTETPEAPPVDPGDGTGSIQVTAVDEGFPIIGSCIDIQGPVSGEVCDGSPGDASPEQGVVLIEDLPTGQYSVSMPNPPPGFDPAAPVDVTVGAGEQANVVLETGTDAPPEPETGNLTLSKVDPDGTPLGGSCFAVGDVAQVCDNGDGDADPTPGSIRFEDLPAGPYTVQETQSPEGFVAAEPFTVEVTEGGEATAQVINEPEAPATGQLSIIKRDQNNDRVGGACFALSGAAEIGPFCDNGPEDTDDRDGVIRVDVPVGDYTLTETQVPEGYEGADPVQVTITPGERTQLTLINTELAGSIEITKTDEEGNLFGGACFTIDDQLQVCDNGEGDANPESGIVLIEGIAPGTRTVAEQPIEGFETPDPQQVDVAPGETSQVSFVNVAQTGSLQITKTDENGDLLGGACFTVNGTEVCDNGEGDTSGESGIVIVEDLPAGDYTVTESQAPANYVASTESQSVTVPAGGQGTVEFENQPDTGALRIVKTDEDGNLLPGSCFTVGEQEICDNGEGDNDPAEGVIEVLGLTSGTYTVTETQAPEGYAPQQESNGVQIEASVVTDLTVVNEQQAGSIAIRKVDAADGQTLLPGACFQVDDGVIVCDNGEGDADPTEGLVLIQGVAPGTHSVTETQSPEGYTASGAQEVNVAAGETAEVTFENSQAAGSIRIVKTDAETGGLLPGACFSLNGGTPVCDNDDVDGDGELGQIVINGVASGSYEITETTTPDGYVAGDPQTVEVAAGEQATVTFENQPIPEDIGSLRITKVDDATDLPLGGACFSVNGGEPVCDNDEADGDQTVGVVLITELSAGDVEVVESQAPSGYQALEDAQTATIAPGETTELEFRNSAVAGTVIINKTDGETGAPLGGACFTLASEDQTYGPVCDGGDGDANPAEGVIEITGVDPDVYNVIEETTPEGYVVPEGPVFEGLQVGETEPAVIDIANEPETAPEPEPVETGTLEIEKVDTGGNLLGGACFQLSGDTTVGPVCDDDAADLNPADGLITIGDIPIGGYTLIETEAPEGFSEGPNQQVEIASEETTSIQVTNQVDELPTGNLRIIPTGQEGNPVGGACYTVNGTNVCDNGLDDADPATGQILLIGLTEATYQVTETQAPAGFSLADPQTVDVIGGEETVLEIAHEPAPLETGGLQFELDDPDGNPIPGACVTLSGDDNFGVDQLLCDGGPEDEDPTPGVLVVSDLPVGVYSVRQAPTEGIGGINGDPSLRRLLQPNDPTVQSLLQAVGSEKTVQVKANIIIIVIIIIIQPPTDGTLDIIKRADDTNQLQGGACFRVSGQGSDVEVCDNDGTDANGTVGILRIPNLPPGSYTVEEIQVPLGYDPAPNRTIDIQAGLIRTITMRDPVSDSPGTITIVKVDPEGDSIPGSCFAMRQGGVIVAGPVCDADDGTDNGRVTFTNLVPGSYMLEETRTPAGYEAAPNQPVTIVAGQNTDLPMVNYPLPGSIRIVKLDENGNGPLGGACFGLDRGQGLEYEICDQGVGDGAPEVGIIRFANIPPGDYILVETVAPPGYLATVVMEITVQPNQQLDLNIENEPQPPSPVTGTLVISKRTEQGNALAGACFVLRQGHATKVGQICDGDDGSNDGTIRFNNVPVGSYAVIETVKPSPNYFTPPVKYVTIQQNQTTNVNIVNVLKPGRILVTKVNQYDKPLAGACFKVSPSNQPALCTDGSGTVVFNNLKPGSYTITETRAPYGYLTAPPVTNIVVNPGLTTPMKVVDKKAPPPPDSGSIRLIKFFCPAGKGGELTTVQKSTDPGVTSLAQTANCKVGNATFVLTPQSGQGGGPIKFSTGANGEAQVPLRAGTYTLTEQGTGVQVQVQVFVGQQTTVVVINYIVPPPPAPVAIKVFKFTCDPGFVGQFYIDFISNCGDHESRTNGVPFRISGASIGTRVTGDGGLRGQTTFSQLPAGQYTVTEQVPVGAGTVYTWCGLTPEGDEYGRVGSSISFPLASGQTMWCAFFNVPDPVTETTGTIVVHKFACELPATKRPANFNWFQECSVQSTGVKFGLSEFLDGVFKPKSSSITDQNGILRFTDLRPGTYELKEIGGDWCFAESDSVDAQGNIVVTAGQRVNVWIFNCIPTKQPPNTGAGTTAAPELSPAAPPVVTREQEGDAVAMLMAWPVAAVGSLWLLRWRRQAA
jgi:uncharacterized surface anchored protein